MKSKTPPMGEVSRGLLPSFTPAGPSLFAIRTQRIANRYATSIEAAFIVAALAFGGGK